MCLPEPWAHAISCMNCLPHILGPKEKNAAKIELDPKMFH